MFAVGLGRDPSFNFYASGRVVGLVVSLLPLDCSGPSGLRILLDSSQVQVLVRHLHCTAPMDRFRGGRVVWTLATLRVSRSWMVGLRFGVR